MKFHVLQHVPFEDEGAIKSWAKSHDIAITRTRQFANEPYPSVDEFDVLIVMGGPMGIYDEAIYPWLAQEKIFIRDAFERGKSILGICLGAQLLADVLGAKVKKNTCKEIGWFKVSLTDEGANTPLMKGLPSEFTALHWHGDTFEIPPNCIPLAKSPACQNQGFSYKSQILGFQFHIESTKEGLGKLVENCREELTKEQFVQSEQELLAEHVHYEGMERLLDTVLSNFTHPLQQPHS